MATDSYGLVQAFCPRPVLAWSSSMRSDAWALVKFSSKQEQTFMRSGSGCRHSSMECTASSLPLSTPLSVRAGGLDGRAGAGERRIITSRV